MSIRLRFTLIFMMVLTVTYLGCYALNNLYLEDYYIHAKCNTMKQAYESLITLVEDDDGQYEDLVDYLITIQQQSGISCIVQISRTLAIAPEGVNAEWMMERLVSLRMGHKTFAGDENIIEANENYCMRYSDSEVQNLHYIDTWGKLPGNTWFLMSMPVEGITESAVISNRFYIYIGCIGIVLGTLIVFFALGRATRPISRLTEISKKMSELDFDVKYTEPTVDEIGELGHNLNVLSERLEHTMTDLRNANSKLQNDIKKREQLEVQRTEFISNVSHELKTPIALIQGYAEGLVEGISDDPETTKYYCEVIMDEASKMNRMVRQLLSLNQIELGNNQMDIRRFDIVELIRGTINAQEIVLRQKNVLVIFGQYSPVYVWGDEYKLEEVVTNYLSNALNHIAGKREIRIDIIKKSGSVCVQVSNTGKHIPEEELNRIWEKFYKVDKARTREYGGHGIGLSIVKAIMERHGGSCGAYNNENGVTFWFELKDGSEV